MQPYEDIIKTEKVLKKLVYEAKNSNVDVVSKLKDINIIINTINNYEEMLKNKYYTDFFDILILSRIYQTLLKDQKDININEFLMWFEKDLRDGGEYIKENIVDYLQHIQLSNSIKKGKINVSSKDSWKTSINSLLKQVKAKIKWNKQWS